jgi:hypothetical protein
MLFFGDANDHGKAEGGSTENSKLPKRIRTALGKQGAKVARKKRRA